MTWDAHIAARNDAVRSAGRWRSTRDLTGGHPHTRIASDGRSVVSFASNDYLGLSQHAAVRDAARAALEEYGTGSGSARLIVGSRPIHSQLEDALAAWKGTEAALLLPTGYVANLALLTGLGDRDGVVIVSDELNHASIIDAARLSRATVRVFPHRDVDAADAHLRDAERAILVSDSVFSMDGDVADLDALHALARDTGAFLVLDEAHAVLGPTLAPSQVAGPDVALVGTLSKTLGSVGGFVAGSRALVDLLVNCARPFIFTTAPPPADSAAALAALRVVCSSEGDERRARLASHVERIAPGHPSPIIPVIVGAEDDAVEASAALLDRGLLVPAIRPPTVAPGTCRLRVALSAAHSDADVGQLAAALDELDLAVAPTAADA